MASIIDLRRASLTRDLPELVRDARRLVGWSQRELAERARTSQATIWRIETSRWDRLDVAVVERILLALGIRTQLAVDARHLDDRRRQQDALHALLNPYVERRLRRAGWLTTTEAQLGDPEARGWIDTLAFRPSDRALLIEETKTDVPDTGGLQRSLTYYERASWTAARRFGWYARTVHVLVVCLDTAAMRARLADNRGWVGSAFPGRVDEMQAWLREPDRPAPSGWTIALADPASRSARWLGAVRRDSRLPPPYGDYADAVRVLRSRGPARLAARP